MTRLSPRHPRYASLRLRARLAAAARRGIVVPEGLIAQGRAEAFDYLLGERTTPSARRAEKLVARWLLAAQRPVLSVNGNVAALAATEVAELAQALPSLGIEVNLFHRTPARVRAIASVLRQAGVRPVLGTRPTRRIPGLPSDRALVDADGIWRADLCVIPLEDGDRAEALHRRGARIVAIDLNPLSRTAQSADVAIVDELTRALRGITAELRRGPRPLPLSTLPAWARRLPELTLERMRRSLPRPSARGWSAGRPPRGSARRSRRRR
ncbi:MAG TPA: phosphopantothenate/pantothenate synthetase [Thermoplasmata archaeon]|nr:phosphopantothenate/pantothenate synthetase [Thermoplasmata archaeon]